MNKAAATATRSPFSKRILRLFEISIAREVRPRSRDSCGSAVLCAGELAADPPGVLDVALHLLDQLVDLGVGALSPQALDEGDPEDLAVEVFFAIDQVGLDQDSPAALEGRA